jgi:hypothetical protein
MPTINSRFENETLERLRTILTTLATTLNVEIVDPATGLPMTPAYDSSVVAVGDAVESLNESVILLRRIAKLLEPMATQDVNNRQKVNIEAVGTSFTTNASNMGSVDTRYMIADWARTAYNTGIRAKLT